MQINDDKNFYLELKEAVDECERELQAWKFGLASGDCTAEEIEDIILPELYHYMFLYEFPRVTLRSPKDQIECAKLFEDKSTNSRMATLILQLAEKYN